MKKWQKYHIKKKKPITAIQEKKNQQILGTLLVLKICK